jgi:predicted membrane protein
MRPVLSRLLVGFHNGPLNYSGLFMWFWLTFLIVARFRFIRIRDTLYFNSQDNPEFWYTRYNMMFPPNFLHNRLSAHYIEINHIFAIEMMKRYQVARKEILSERDRQSDEVKRTKYITNPNYVYEPLGPDDDKIKRLKDDGLF